MKKLLILFALTVTGMIAMTAHLNAEQRHQNNAYQHIATFAGGCFWCMEKPFESMPGILKVMSGYAGGTTPNPTYKFVSSGKSDYVEAIQVVYDPTLITYRDLLAFFWRQIDPTDSGGQFVDRGAQYRTVIFYHDDQQKRIAEESKRALNQSGIFKKPIVTDIRKATTFYQAESYHQDYAKKNPIRYKLYRYYSGRDKFLKKAWSKVKNLYQNHFQKPNTAT